MFGRHDRASHHQTRGALMPDPNLCAGQNFRHGSTKNTPLIFTDWWHHFEDLRWRAIS